ncbi:MAG: DUF502 domain-containing protein [Planctomycetales bacterium]
MSTAPPSVPVPATTPRKRATATYFFLRGLAIIVPPVATLLILLWIANAFNTYIIQPINGVVRYGMAQFSNNIRPRDTLEPAPRRFPGLPDWHHNYRVTPRLLEEFKRGEPPNSEQLLSDRYADDVFVPMGKGTDPGQYVPLADHDLVFKHFRPQPLPKTAIGLYMEIAAVRSFRTSWQLTAVGLSITTVALYFLGRFVTARIGAWFVHKFEFVLTRLPLVRNVYSTVKQVTDFVLSDREVEFKRVVALEYPRSGSWTLGFVTGEGMLECAAAVGEPMLSVLVATSPMPMGGFTVMVPKSQVIDLDMTVDQALQFIVSCGVLIPPQQQQPSSADRLEAETRGRQAALAAEAVSNGQRGTPVVGGPGK